MTYRSRPHIQPLSKHWKNEFRSLQTQIQSAKLLYVRYPASVVQGDGNSYLIGNACSPRREHHIQYTGKTMTYSMGLRTMRPIPCLRSHELMLLCEA